MKERITLLLLIVSLWVFLFIFQNYIDTCWAVIFLISLMVIYMVYMHAAIRHRKRELLNKLLDENCKFRPFVSIMIPCRNEENVIEETVNNILKMDYEPFEIIVIDDRSTDKTGEKIKEFAAKNEKIKYLIRQEGAFPGKSAVLNDALLLAKGEAILVFDADARVEPDFLKKLVIPLEDKEVGAVQARKIISNKDRNTFTRCQYNEYAVDTYLQIGRDAVKGAVELRGNGELIKRTALDDINGWNNYTIVDDLDMSTRLHIKGWDVRFCPEAEVYEEGVTTYVGLLKQRRRWVEGSIRRYLEHMWDVFFSKDMSLRVSMDLIAYISEFLLPFWLVSEVLFQIFRFTKGYDNNLLSSVTLILIVGIFFFCSLMYSLKRYCDYSKRNSVKQAIKTSIFVLLFWTPLVFFIVFKIIFLPKTMDWGKTKHGTKKVKEGIEAKINV